tara:strand:+ start:198 stop:401 length:204 start_codon:yes stop_codon:yes gene_type:complete
MDIKIESGIPMPTKNYEYLKKLKVGDSYVLPYSIPEQNKLRQAFDRQNMKCVFRKQNNNTMRVWRVK